MDIKAIEDTIWTKYKSSKQYLDDNGIVNKTDKNWRFYLDDQWHGLKTVTKDKPPFLNFIKKNVKYKVGTICQNRQSAHYSTSAQIENAEAICQALDKEYASRWAKGKMDTKVWDMAKASAIQGDAYIYWGTTEFAESQILPNTSVLLSDEQSEDIQGQKYIIIRERLFVKDVIDAALANGCDPDDVEFLTSDDDNKYQIGNKEDVKGNDKDGKITSIIYMEKINGLVHVAKAVENLVYEPLHPIVQKMSETGEESQDGLKLYPIANMVWESYPNSARGKSAVEPLIPNQIEENKTLYRRVLSTKLSSFPRMAYNVDAIQNPSDINKVGAAIAVRNIGAQSISQLISYLPPQAMSQDAKTLDDDLLSITTSLSGSDDAITGTTDLARVASSTVLAVKDQQALNLNENVAKVKKLYEDIARIWFDQLRTYKPDGITVGGTKVTGDMLRQLEPEVEINVTQDTVWTRDNEQTFWDNMLEKKYITFEEYCKSIPEGGSAPKDKLLKILDQRKLQEAITSAAEEIYDSNNPEQAPETGDVNELQ